MHCYDIDDRRNEIEWIISKGEKKIKGMDDSDRGAKMPGSGVVIGGWSAGDRWLTGSDQSPGMNDDEDEGEVDD